MKNNEKNKKRIISFTAWAAYLLIFFEMLYMATPFTDTGSDIDSSNWKLSMFDSGSVGKYISLVLDNSNNPHFSYYDNTYFKQYYAKKK